MKDDRRKMNAIARLPFCDRGRRALSAVFIRRGASLRPYHVSQLRIRLPVVY
jgi:hypothetical protein